MKRATSYILTLGGLLATAASLAGIYAVTKANSMVVPMADDLLLAPPTITATPLTPELAATLVSPDPLSNSTWQQAKWTKLIAPLHGGREAASTWATFNFDGSNLHLAVIAELTPAITDRDAVSLWIDSSIAQNGTELLEVRISPNGDTKTTWYRAAMPPQPKENGAPNFNHPMSTIPDVAVKGLVAKVKHGQFGSQQAWGAVITLPMNELPKPLRIASPLTVASKFKVNVIRQHGIGGGLLAQSNLSPVWTGGQVVSPYRLSPLVFGDNSSLASRHGTRE